MADSPAFTSDSILLIYAELYVRLAEADLEEKGKVLTLPILIASSSDSTYDLFAQRHNAPTASNIISRIILLVILSLM